MMEHNPKIIFKEHVLHDSAKRRRRLVALERTKRLAWSITTALVKLYLALLVIGLCRNGCKSWRYGNAAERKAQLILETRGKDAGTTCTLITDTGLPLVPVEKSGDDYVRKRSVAELIRSGNAWLADVGTTARVMENNMVHRTYRVRIISGQYANKEGWVHYKWVR